MVTRTQRLWQSYAAVNVSLADVVVAQLRKGEYFRTTLPPGESRVRIAEFGMPVALEAGQRRFLRASPPNADDVPAFTDEVEAIEELTSIMFPIVPAL